MAPNSPGRPPGARAGGPRRGSRVLVVLLLVSLSGPAVVEAQSRPRTTLIGEAGGGVGTVGGGFGPMLRLALRYTGSRWGLAGRFISHAGPRGETIEGLFGSHTLTESFEERAFLLTRKLGSYVVAGAGVGRFEGNEISENGRNLEALGPTTSFPFEVGAYSDEGFVNVGLVVHGNLNGEASQIGLTVNVALGRWPLLAPALRSR